MAQTHNFRSAIGGFNREDVVHYIEYLNTKNTNLVNQLKSENQALKEELAALRSQEQAPAAPVEETQPEPQPEAAPQNNVPLAEQELEAYRRAERMERKARERVQEIYQQVTATLAEATAQLDGAMTSYNQLAASVATQIAQLQTAVESSKAALENATATMGAIRPQETDE